MNIAYKFGQLSLFFCLTPWASWGTNSLDSQPWPILFSILYLLLFAKSSIIPKSYVYILTWTVFILCVAAAVAPVSNEVLARGVISYLTIPIVMIFYYEFANRFGPPKGTLIFTNYLWVIVGILESVDPTFTSWASSTRTTELRGVTSLAPEPTFFAVYLIFSSWVLLVSEGYRPNKRTLTLIAINLISVVVLAKSSMGIIFMLVFSLSWYAGRFGVSAGIPTFGIAAISLIVLFPNYSETLIRIFENTRIGMLIEYLDVHGVYGVIYSDASINTRVEHIVLPTHGFIDNSFLPRGFTGFAKSSIILSQFYDGLFWYSEPQDKIMSWAGAILFEMGFLGLVLIAMVFYTCWNHSSVRIIEIGCLAILLIAAIPLAFSLVPILLVALRLNDRNHKFT